MSPAACTAGEWREFHSTEGAFTVIMPGDPVITTRNSDTPVGPIALKTFTVKIAQSQAAYMVAYNDYPAAILKTSKPNDILARVVQGAVGTDGKVASQKPQSMKHYPGRSVQAKVKSGLAYESRFFLVGTRLYQISIISEPQGVEPEDRSRFFDSFTLIEKK